MSKKTEKHIGSKAIGMKEIKLDLIDRTKIKRLSLDLRTLSAALLGTGLHAPMRSFEAKIMPDGAVGIKAVVIDIESPK
jgi:hypothetical protein